MRSAQPNKAKSVNGRDPSEISTTIRAMKRFFNLHFLNSVGNG